MLVSFFSLNAHAQEGHTLQGNSISIDANTVLPSFSVSDQTDWSDPKYLVLDTARNEINWSTRDKNMIREVNYVRVYPAEYAKFLNDFIQIRKNIAKYFPSLSEEMNNTIKEAQLFSLELKNTKPMGVLKPLSCLHASAQAHAQYLKNSQNFSHTGANGSLPENRITDSCRGTSLQLQGMGENLVEGSSTSIREAILSLLVDYGVEDRGHRLNLLYRRWTYLGVGEYQKIWTDVQESSGWVQDFATE